MAITPFEKGFKSLEPVGKNVLIEITQEKATTEKKVGSLIVPGQSKANLPQFGLVKKVGNKVEIEVHAGDFVEINSQFYPNIVDNEGFGKYQLVHEEQITGVYKKE